MSLKSVDHPQNTSQKRVTKTVQKNFVKSGQPLTSNVSQKIVPFLLQSQQILMPNASLPLKIQKPSDLVAINRAFRTNREIALIQSMDFDASGEKDTSKKVFQIGCLGRITSFSEEKNGIYYVVLKGLYRFKAERLHKTKRGPLLHINCAPFIKDAKGFQCRGDDQMQAKRKDLLSLATKFIKENQIAVDTNLLETASNESLSTTLAMVCPFEGSEKQAILESKTLTERFALIEACLLLRMSAHPLYTSPSKGFLN